ncbi:MAG: helix-turn-helix transcriptional regulator [Carnobacterium sp.]
MSTLFSRIIDITKQNNLSGKEFGKIIGLEKSPLTDWKNRKSKPTLDQIIKICDFFAISSDYLLFGIVDTNITSTLSEDETELIDTYRKMDRRGQCKVQTVIYEEIDRIKEEKVISSKGKAIG